jgi:hypothetical protein
MNQAQRRAVEAAIGNAEDNLYLAVLCSRAELEQSRSGGTAAIKTAECIAVLEQRIAELKEGL